MTVIGSHSWLDGPPRQRADDMRRRKFSVNHTEDQNTTAEADVQREATKVTDSTMGADSTSTDLNSVPADAPLTDEEPRDEG